MLPWVSRAQGEVNYYLTQALTGHGCLKEYLCRFKKKIDALCESCEDEEDDANNTLFICKKFDEERGRLSRIIGVTLTSDNMVQEMLRNEKNWSIISKHVGAITKIDQRGRSTELAEEEEFKKEIKNNNEGSLFIKLNQHGSPMEGTSSGTRDIFFSEVGMS